MSTREGETGIVRRDGDRGGLQLDDVQRGESPRTETNWHHAFLVLSQALGSSFIGSDTFRLLALALERQCGREAATEFLLTAGSRRSSFMNEFMG